MQSWEICEIEVETSTKLNGKYTKKLKANLYTPKGLKVICESQSFPDISLSNEWKIFVANLANDGWEPIPVQERSTGSGFYNVLWLFKRPKPN